MAEAPGHLLGQIIGNALESSVEPLLSSIAKRHGLYFDKRGGRPARPGSKVTWTDGLGNSHDLDFVLERGGTESLIGEPAAFIESAWRRYTKHSRAKSQEIQGALLPLLLHYSNVKPFAGVVVAGRWTTSALQQMRSSGFSVLHVEYELIVDAFDRFGIDIDADEGTSDSHLRDQVEAYRRLDIEEQASLAALLCSNASNEYIQFESALNLSLARKVSRVVVIALHGEEFEFASPADASRAISEYSTARSVQGNFSKFEIHMYYSNGDSIVANFDSKANAVQFVNSFT